MAQAAGGSGQTDFPAYQRFTGSVGGSGSWTQSFTLGSGDLGAPISATITLDGSVVCTIDLGPLGCFMYEWSPDLDARLFDPNGFAVADSTCAADDDCVTGRQETIHYLPTVAGTYTLRVYPYGGVGGSFSVDLFHGPVATSTPPPPAIVHVGDLDDTSSLTTKGWKAQVLILVHDNGHAIVPGAVVTGKWPNGTTASCTTNTNGRCRIGRNLAKSKLSIVFAVTKIASSVDAYAAADNHDPDGDSTGTKITLTKP